MKPILFNTDMVRAILAGKKTQTRRPVHQVFVDALQYPARLSHPEMTDMDYLNRYASAKYCVGDILYVRETWGTWSPTLGTMPRIYYRADEDLPDGIEWKPSIHMPKEAARIFLRVTNVRVERLNDITEEEVFKEGYRGCDQGHTVYHVDPPESCWNVPDCPRDLDCLRLSFAEMFGVDVWDKTIKPGELDKYGWYANPWVWVIDFERTEKEEKK